MFSRPFAAVLLFASSSALLGCPSRTTSEVGEDACSNGVDDDGDSFIDCADTACRLFSFCLGGRDAGPPDVGTPDSNIGDVGDAPASVCTEPLDVVFVIDVSTSMAGELADVQEGLAGIWDTASRLSTSPRFGLVVFVDDALAVNNCAPFATREDLAAELNRWQTFCATNRSPTSALANTDCAENSLDAMSTAITECTWRADATHVLVHITDDTFAERPAVLSGAFGPGILVAATYPEVGSALVAQQIRVGAFAMNGRGDSCGAGTSPDVGRGFHMGYGSELSLPERTGGAVWDLRMVRTGALDMGTAIQGLLEREQCTVF
jgi:hypothetical protein